MNRRKVQVTGLNARPGSDILVFLPVRLSTFGDYLSSPEVATDINIALMRPLT